MHVNILFLNLTKIRWYARVDTEKFLFIQFNLN